MLELTKAEELVVKHFEAKLSRKFYVWLGIGLINMLLGKAMGYSLDILEGAKLWLEPFRQAVNRNDPDQINGLLINALRTSYQEEKGEQPDAEFTKDVTAKANKVRLDYMALFPSPDD